MNNEGIVKVEMAPWASVYVNEWKQKKHANQELQDLLSAVSLLTDLQLETAIFRIDPQDSYRADVARFFFQELMRRDEKKALDVLRRWQQGQSENNK